MRLLDIHEVSERTTLSEDTIYSRMADSTFPRQLRLGPNKVGWLESDIGTWIAQQSSKNEHEPRGTKNTDD